MTLSKTAVSILVRLKQMPLHRLSSIETIVCRTQ